MSVQNFIKLSALVYELSCPQTFFPIRQLWKIRKTVPVTLNCDLWPWNYLVFSGAQGTFPCKISSSSK